jgi:hypothetical protein
MAFRIICAQDPPDHSTIARFRLANAARFADLFTRCCCCCSVGDGPVRQGKVAIDGTKVAGSASVAANVGATAGPCPPATAGCRALHIETACRRGGAPGSAGRRHAPRLRAGGCWVHYGRRIAVGRDVGAAGATRSPARLQALTPPTRPTCCWSILPPPSQHSSPPTCTEVSMSASSGRSRWPGWRWPGLGSLWPTCMRESNAPAQPHWPRRVTGSMPSVPDSPLGGSGQPGAGARKGWPTSCRWRSAWA